MIAQSTDLGAAAVALSANETECAQLQKVPFFAGVACGLGSLGAVGTGIYKLGKGKGGALGAFAASVGLWFLGNRLIVSAANSFQACRGQPPIAPVPGAPPAP